MKHSRLQRILCIALVVAISFVQLLVTFRGLDQKEAMDMAQIARNVANGDGYTTAVLRPKMMMDTIKAARADKDLELHFYNLEDTSYAPLYVYTLAGALKLTGAADFEKSRMFEGGSLLYGPDRVVAATSLLFFLVSLMLIYVLIARLFDDTVALVTIIFMSVSDVMLKFSVSGLAQPMMLCFFLLAMQMLALAVQSQKDKRPWAPIIYTSLTFLFLSALCLTSWMGIWVALGLLVFVSIYFRPMGLYALIGLVVLTVVLALPVMNLATLTGSVFGNAYYAFYNSFGGGEDMVMRSTQIGNIPLNSANFALRLFGYAFAQLNELYVNLGSIIVAPFFFLSLFNIYRRTQAEAVKWAILSVWIFVSLGMALFGVNQPVHASQLYVLLTPFFVAYGVSLLFNFISRLNLMTDYILVRNFIVIMLVIISAAPFLLALPTALYRGVWLGARGTPAFPPYYPFALNHTLEKSTNDKEVIVSDQPWAVAWYGNRISMWTPLRASDFSNELLPMLESQDMDVQGFLVTPCSFSLDRQAANTPGGLTGVVAQAGDFAPLALEGSLLLISPKRNFYFADLFAGTDAYNSVGSIISSRGRYRYRQPILGAQMLYYSKTPARKF